MIPAKHALIGAICGPFPAGRTTRVVVLDARTMECATTGVPAAARRADIRARRAGQLEM